jgi:hypothetical protein
MTGGGGVTVNTAAVVDGLLPDQQFSGQHAEGPHCQ